MRPQFETLPEYEQRRVLALRAWWNDLSEEQRQLARKDRILRAVVADLRRRKRKEATERIIALIDDGRTHEEIAAQFGWTLSWLRRRCAAYGIPIIGKAGHRRAPAVMMHADHYAALARLAVDRDEEPGETLELIVAYQLADDAAAARRDTRTARKVEA